MDAQDYRPVYDTTELERYLDASQVGGFSTRPPTTIDPSYCLTFPSAIVLASLFTPPPLVYMDVPIRQADGSPFNAAFSHNVPWLKFSSGVVRNAGQLAQYWGMEGVSYSAAMMYAQIDINTPVGV